MVKTMVKTTIFLPKAGNFMYKRKKGVIKWKFLYIKVVDSFWGRYRVKPLGFFSARAVFLSPKTNVPAKISTTNLS